MAGSTFKTNPYSLHELLISCQKGVMQLPDFQRSWVWDEDRIKSLIASVSRAFPIGALMTLETGGEVDFKPRPVEGAPAAAKEKSPHSLLLDGQQRMTSLYQVTLRGQVVETITPKKKKVKRWFYIDIAKALDPSVERDDAIISVPADKTITADFGREVVLDLTTQAKEYEALMYPVCRAFDWDDWQDGFNEFWKAPDQEHVRQDFRRFRREILENFKSYDVPVITLGSGTTKEAVCVVFEKVNTGGKPLDAFELVTAMYAAAGHELRRDWYGKEGEFGRQHRLSVTARFGDEDTGILSEVSNTDFLHAVSLFHTRERRREAGEAGKQGKELPAVSGNRQALLNLPLSAYLKYQQQVEGGFVRAAKFLHMLNIYRVFDLPYQSQIVPLAAILADIGDAWEHSANRARLVQWYWNGVFGELYGSTVESRIARDFMEVPAWLLEGGNLPTTIRDATFRAERLKTMRMRLSAAYKGVNALLMNVGARDFRSGQPFNYSAFFGENVDIHHIFPKAWCEAQGIKSAVYDSIINKTPLSYRTNRIIGGAAPSVYLAKLESGNAETPAIGRDDLDRYLASHLISPAALRSDDFLAFMEDRQERLLRLIEQATGQSVYRDQHSGEAEDAETDDETAEADLTISEPDQGNGDAFDPRERSRQTAYFAAEFPGSAGYNGAGYRLVPEQAGLNLAPSIREVAPAYFSRNGITWHTHANHGLSSQVCCLNFLMPLARRPDILGHFVGAALGIANPEMLPVEAGPDGRPWFVGFEWIGGDYLNESSGNGSRTRGANCTSADAVLRFWHNGTTETLLIEWKYTERYGQPIPPEGNETRLRRYKDIVFDPSGPIRSDLGLQLEDFFWEPFYQLLRQQMLAFQMQKAREHGADRVRVLHISPKANTALRKVTAPSLRRFGDDAFDVFRSVLTQPDAFISRSTEDLMGTLVGKLGEEDEWSSYLARRYAFISPAAS